MSLLTIVTEGGNSLKPESVSEWVLTVYCIDHVLLRGPAEVLVTGGLNRRFGFSRQYGQDRAARQRKEDCTEDEHWREGQQHQLIATSPIHYPPGKNWSYEKANIVEYAHGAHQTREPAAAKVVSHH